MKNLHLLFIIILSTFQIYIQNTNAQDYYPLNSKNQWAYKIEQDDPNLPGLYHCDTLTVNVKSDTIINGYHYFVLDTTDLSGASMKYFEHSHPDLPSGKIVRCDSNTIYYYNEEHNSDVMFYKLNAKIDEYWMADNLKILLLSRYVKEYFGISTKIIKYQLGDYPWNFIEISEDFGMVHFVYSGGLQIYKNIIGCKLSNIDYGFVVSVNNDYTKKYEIKLYQNYPNPFNRTTTIKYNLNKLSKVRLNIYNLYGQELETFSYEFQAAGEHEIIWETKDLPSGIYFYKLQAEYPSTSLGQRFSETKKLILQK